MLTRNQKHAVQIFDQVDEFREEPETKRNKYGSMAHRLPALIRTAGLAQALAFVAARGTDEQKRLLDHIASVVGLPNGVSLLERSRTAELSDYMRLTREVLPALNWYKRFAQSVLGVEVDDEGEGEH